MQERAPIPGGIESLELSTTRDGEGLLSITLQDRPGYSAEEKIKITVIVDADDNPTIVELQRRALIAAREWLDEFIVGFDEILKT